MGVHVHTCRSVESELEVERGQRKEAETQLTQSRTQLSQEKTEMGRYKTILLHVCYIRVYNV